MENITFAPDARQQIILAAFTAAGPGADDLAVSAQVERIADAMLPGSPMYRALDEVEHYWRETVVEVNKPFIATLLYVDMEATSQRPVLALRSEPNTSNPEGKFELIKLGMARGRNRTRVIEQAKSYIQLIGHQVTVTRMNEKTSDGRKASVLRSAVSNGQNAALTQLHVAKADDAQAVEAKLAAGARLVNWSALNDTDRKVASKLQKLQARLDGNQVQQRLQGNWQPSQPFQPPQGQPMRQGAQRPAQSASEPQFATQVPQGASQGQFASQTPPWER